MSTRRITRDSALGRIVDRTDPSALAAGLRAVLSDESARRRVAEEGPAAVRKTFSVARVGRQLRALYERVRSPTSSYGN